MILIVNESGCRKISATEIPLAVGVSKNGSVIYGGRAELSPAIWVRTHENRVYIQPDGTNYEVTHNDTLIVGSAWLQSGDRIGVGEATISVAFDDGMLILSSQKAPPPALPPSDAPPEPATDGAIALQGDSRPVNQAAPKASVLPAHPRRRLRRLVLLAGFGVLLLGVGFVLTASPVRLNIQPAPASVQFAAYLPAFEFGGRYLALPGNYSLKASLPGYHTLEKRVVVKFWFDHDFTYQLKKLPGRLHVSVQPATAATVSIDGKTAGPAPLESFSIDAGRHEIGISAERFFPAARSIQIRGMGETQSLAIELRPAWGFLTVKSEPPQATVKLDGKFAGRTPVALEPLQGERQITIEKEGWKPVTATVTVKAGVAAEPASFKLEKVDGILDVQSKPAGAIVAIGDQFRGRTPVSFPLISGQVYRLRLTKPGFSQFVRDVPIEAEKTAKVNAVLSPEYGIVFLRSRPSGSRLRVDGKDFGSASQRLKLTTAPHRLEISKPGYELYSTVVTPRKGIPKSLVVRLNKKIDVLRQKTRDGIKSKSGHVLRFVAIENPVRFIVGASRREAGRRSNETRYTVELTRSYLIGAKEVTNAEFRRFRDRHNSGTAHGNSLNAPDQPVVSVSWDEAARYSNWLSKQEGLPPAYREMNGKMVAVEPMTTGYRLPTEAEWAFAARYDGGRMQLAQPLKYTWGQSMPPATDSGNFADRSASGRLPFVIQGYSDGYPVSAPVGKFKPNKSGLYDLAGNVAEWCHDYYDTRISMDRAVSRDPTGPKSGTFHVVRGSSWRHGQITELRLSYRDYAKSSRNDLGFRIARYVELSK